MKKYENLFVYGTLKKSDVQKTVISRAIKGTPDILEGYKKSKIKINDNTYPIIEPNPEYHVKGLVISVTQKELKLIDKYETKAYKRRKVILKSDTSAWAYQK